MKLRISPTILDEVSAAIEDALGHHDKDWCDPTDATYLKINAAANAAKSHKRGFLIDVDADDIAELKDRAEYNVGPYGVCNENLDYAYDKHDRAYWLNRSRAYTGLLKQIAALKQPFNTTPPATSSQEITMTARFTISTTQHDILERAIDNHEGQIVWFPDNVKGGARQKVLQGLFSKALITRDGNDNWFVAAEGYDALGRTRSAPTASHPDPEVEAAVATSEATWAQEKQEAAQRLLKTGIEGKPRLRDNSKQATVIEMLHRPNGVTINEICEATGWQAHTVRGTFAGALKKKLGLNITSFKDTGATRVYRIV